MKDLMHRMQGVRVWNLGNFAAGVAQPTAPPSKSGPWPPMDTPGSVYRQCSPSLGSARVGGGQIIVIILHSLAGAFRITKRLLILARRHAAVPTLDYSLRSDRSPSLGSASLGSEVAA
jgi:hypothetical protein